MTKKKKKKSKTAFCAFLFAALLPFTAKAQTVNLDLTYTAQPFGQASQSASILYGLDKTLTYTATLRQVTVDSSGNLNVSASGGGTVVANQGNGLPGGNTTNSWLTSDNYVAGYLTSTAGGSAPRGGSITAVAVTGTVLVNITTAAGVDGPCVVTIEGGTGPNAGLYWGILPNSTWVRPVSYLAVSTTPIMVTVGSGSHLQLSATAAAVTVNARVWYAPIQ